MANARSVFVFTRQIPLWKKALSFCVAWGAAVGALGVSRVWFGGAWVVDLAVLVLIVISAVNALQHSMGAVVSLSVAETEAWIAAGAPKDVKGWKAGRDATR